jgi:hypothetical protein
MEIIVREANLNDAGEIALLFCENGSNPYDWTAEKWKHYYLDYPEGKAISLVAEIERVIIGHYGILPVRIGNEPAAIGMHAYVSKNYRGVSIISLLMQKVDAVCKKHGFDLICGFANPNFSMIKERLFKWKTICWLGFKSNLSINDIEDLKTRNFFFNYSKNWYAWRFGRLAPNYISSYTDASGIIHKQLLKTTDNTREITIVDTEGWSPNFMFGSNIINQFSQPFSIKVYNERLLASGIYNYNNWGIEMGDSDTFIYKPWK